MVIIIMAIITKQNKYKSSANLYNSNLGLNAYLPVWYIQGDANVRIVSFLINLFAVKIYFSATRDKWSCYFVWTMRGYIKKKIVCSLKFGFIYDLIFCYIHIFNVFNKLIYLATLIATPLGMSLYKFYNFCRKLSSFVK